MHGRLEIKRGENDERESQTDTKKRWDGTGKGTAGTQRKKRESEGKNVLEEPGPGHSCWDRNQEHKEHYGGKVINKGNEPRKYLLIL